MQLRFLLSHVSTYAFYAIGVLISLGVSSNTNKAALYLEPTLAVFMFVVSFSNISGHVVYCDLNVTPCLLTAERF